MTRVLLVIAAAMALLAGCEQPRTVVTRVQHETRARYADFTEQQRLKEALSAANVPHRVVLDVEQNEWIEYAPEDEDKVAAVKRQVFGPELPSGRHIRFEGAMDQEFRAWLAANAIAYTTVINRGEEYVIWAAEDSPRVAKWPRFPPGYWTHTQEAAAKR